MSRETVVWTTSKPSARSASASSAWVEIWRSRIRRRIAPWRSRRCCGHARTSWRIEIAWATSSGLTVSGGERRSVVGPAEVTSRPASKQRGDGVRAGLEAEQQAGAADGQRLGELGAPLADVREQLVVDRLDDRARGGADDRVAAEGGGVVAGLEPGRRVVGGEQRADRQAVGEPLRERDEVRPHAELLEREERPGAADAGLHLVEAEERAVLGGELGGGGEEAGRRGVDAALALDRLDQDQAGVGPDGRLERRDVVQRREGHAGDERLERRALRGLAGRRERAHRPAVERVLERDDPRLAGRLARVLDRRLDRLGARVAEERLRAAEALGEEARRAPPSARSSRGWRRARAARAAPARRRAAPGARGRARRRRSRRRSRGSASRRRRSARSPRRRRR